MSSEIEPSDRDVLMGEEHDHTHRGNIKFLKFLRKNVMAGNFQPQSQDFQEQMTEAYSVFFVRRDVRCLQMDDHGTWYTMNDTEILSEMSRRIHTIIAESSGTTTVVMGRGRGRGRGRWSKEPGNVQYIEFLNSNLKEYSSLPSRASRIAFCLKTFQQLKDNGTFRFVEPCSSGRGEEELEDAQVINRMRQYLDRYGKRILQSKSKMRTRGRPTKLRSSADPTKVPTQNTSKSPREVKRKDDSDETPTVKIRGRPTKLRPAANPTKVPTQKSSESRRVAERIDDSDETPTVKIRGRPTKLRRAIDPTKVPTQKSSESRRVAEREDDSDETEYASVLSSATHSIDRNMQSSPSDIVDNFFNSVIYHQTVCDDKTGKSKSIVSPSISSSGKRTRVNDDYKYIQGVTITKRPNTTSKSVPSVPTQTSHNILNTGPVMCDPNHAGDDVDTALIFAIKSRCIDIIDLLLADPRTDVNRLGKDGKSPLIVATSMGDVETVQKLLHHGRG